MPTSITIRDIPDDIYEKLKKKAELHHRSVNSEVIFYLGQMVSSQPIDHEELIERAKKIKKQAKGSLSMNEIQKAIQQGRS
jgi:plasmid stability protein